VEQAYFQLWFEGQAPALQAQVQALVAEKRLVFQNGGWSMTDEASPTYVDMLDNVALGHRHIVENFGVAALPKINWQIDPFGVRGGRPAAASPMPPRPSQRSPHTLRPHTTTPPLPRSTLPFRACYPPPWVASRASCGRGRTRA